MEGDAHSLVYVARLPYHAVSTSCGNALGWVLDMSICTTLVATAKNEAPYIWEWVAYHRLVGFDHIIMFQNDSDDGTGTILKVLAEHGFINYKYNNASPGKHQIRAYWRSVKQPEYLKADWIMALDLDEFLVVHTEEGTVKSLLSRLPKDADCVFISWKRFGSGRQVGIETGLVTERFVMSEKDGWIKKFPQPFKSLFRREKFLRPGIHRPLVDPDVKQEYVYVNGSGLGQDQFILRNFQCTDPQERRLAQINHYITRDPQSFVLKSHKGSAHQANRDVDRDYWRKRNKNQMTDLKIQKFGVALHQEMERMDNETGGKLRALTVNAVEHHRSRFHEIIKENSMKELYEFCLDNPC